jgi:hypothetical protein
LKASTPNRKDSEIASGLRFVFSPSFRLKKGAITMKSETKHTETSRKTSTRRQNAQEDIVDLILEDHKLLKPLLKTLKDSDEEIEVRQRAYEEFAVLLVSHAKPEEESRFWFIYG